MGMRVLAIVVVTLGWLAPAPARADEEVYEYGYQTAIMDMAAATIIGTGMGMEEAVVTGTGAFAFVAGATMVHVAQRNYEGALYGASLRVGLPLLVGLAGAGIVKIQDSSSGQDADRPLLETAGPGLVVGALLASVIDAQVFAERERREGDVRLRLLPMATPGGLGASLQGSF